MDFRPKRFPAFDGRVGVGVFECPYRAVERDPRHYLRMYKVPKRSAHLPDAVVGLTPDLLEPFQQNEADAARRHAMSKFIRRPLFMGEGLIERIKNFAEDIELELFRSSITDAHRF